MKKILIGLVMMALLLIGGGYAWYNSEYGGTEYYVKIHEDGEKLTIKGSGNPWHGFEYKKMGYTELGSERKLDFLTFHNLKHEAYLKVIYNDKKGVTSWEEVQQKDVPEKALSKI
ncbi:YxeA family protein [Lactococcus petauri]|uniref:YxeA family protein n=1 Tax=Lactococcus petauri TaxID=1940789 RepID=UPI0038533F7B